jgi:hypothetical protein
MLTRSNISNHFATNRDWKELFEKNYPKINPETYVEDAWKLFERNGYTTEMDRYSNNPKSRVYTALKSIDLLHNGEFITGREQVNEYNALEQLLIMIITDFDVDFTTFK